jgi:Tol biopolymer transport system component
MDRTGKRLGVVGKPGFMRALALSPDEKRVALLVGDPQAAASDIWLLDIARGAMSRFTFGPGLMAGPVWSPDGGSIAFSSRVSVLRDLYRKPVGGAGEQELLLRAAGQNAYIYDWSRDGRSLVYGYGSDAEKAKRDLWLLGLDGDRKPVPYVEAPYNESFGQFSPDGKWMAYASDESGQEQVYIRAIPPTRPPVQVSVAGGTQPRWRRDGRELFYVSVDEKVTAAPIQFTGNGVEAGTPQPLFDFVAASGPAIGFNYQATADGQRFLMLAPPGDEAPAPITVVLNWQAALKK